MAFCITVQLLVCRIHFFISRSINLRPSFALEFPIMAEMENPTAVSGCSYYIAKPSFGNVYAKGSNCESGGDNNFVAVIGFEFPVLVIRLRNCK